MAEETQAEFQFMVEEVYKIGAIGLVLVGKVQTGAIDTRTEPWLVVQRTKQKVQVKAATFMHQQVTDDDYWVKQTAGGSGGFGIKTNVSPKELVEGDLLQLTTPPI